MDTHVDNSNCNTADLMDTAVKDNNSNADDLTGTAVEDSNSNTADLMSTAVEDSNTITADPYAYLERSSFTSEKFKIEVRGLPKFYGMGELKKLLTRKLKLNPVKIKPPKRRSEWLYICFRSEEDRQCAIAKLSGYLWKKNKLTAQPAAAVPDPLVQKRSEYKNCLEPKNENKRDLMKNLSPDELLKSTTVPLWNVPYETQLQMKMDKMRSILTDLGKQLLHANKISSGVENLLENRCKQYNGLPCELVEIRYVPSDSIANGYRNKCEFTIGLNEETGLKTIGFRFGSYVQGTTNVGSIANMPHVMEPMKEVVKQFESFIRKSELNVYNPENHCGFWKQLTVRLGVNTGQAMVVVGVNVHGVTEEQLQQITSDIVNFFVNEDGKSCNVTSLYLQADDMTVSQKTTIDSLKLLHGSSNIVEILCELKFYISPLSFFQPHTAAAEILYNSVGELTPSSSEVTLLDICCGTGTIGLCLAKSGAQILGIESEAAAIENAKLNCQLNSIDNCAFFHGRAEDILSSVICKAVNTDIIAVVDPPRAGLHQKTVTQLRRATNIKKLIYLSCNPKAALQNFVTFGRPPSKTLFGSPFLPVKAIPVDNFPHTNHCELIVCFERYEIPVQVETVIV